MCFIGSHPGLQDVIYTQEFRDMVAPTVHLKMKRFDRLKVVTELLSGQSADEYDLAQAKTERKKKREEKKGGEAAEEKRRAEGETKKKKHVKKKNRKEERKQEENSSALVPHREQGVANVAGRANQTRMAKEDGKWPNEDGSANQKVMMNFMIDKVAAETEVKLLRVQKTEETKRQAELAKIMAENAKQIARRDRAHKATLGSIIRNQKEEAAEIRSHTKQVLGMVVVAGGGSKRKLKKLDKDAKREKREKRQKAKEETAKKKAAFEAAQAAADALGSDSYDTASDSDNESV